MLKRLLILILSVCILFALPSAALAGPEYEIENYAMTIDVETDGSADVTEMLHYDFDGEYNGVVSLFDTDGIGGIEDFHVYIDNAEMQLVDEMTYIDDTYTVTEAGENLFEIRVYSPGRSDTRIVRYEYTMTDLAARYADTAMIHRKFIGENNSVTLQQANIVIALPGDCSGEIPEVFVHGGMDQTDVSRSEKHIVIGPENVYSGSSVEVRLLFPAEWLPDAPLIDQPMYDAAVTEEARITAEEAAQAVRTENAKYIFSAAYILVFSAAWLMLAKKYGLKNRSPQTPDPSLITRYPAAFLTAAVEDEADTDALSGTLMELTAGGHITMEHSEEKGLRFTRKNSDSAGLYPHQAFLLNWLFFKKSFFLSELNAGTNYKLAQSFEKGYNGYVQKVADDMLAANLRYKNDGIRITLNALIIILGTMGTGGILLAGTPNVPLAIITGGMMFLLIALMSRVRRLTDEGEALQAAALVFQKAGIPTNPDYAEYIAYYAALGMTEPLVEAMAANRAAYDSGNDAPVWLYAGWHYSLHTLNRTMRETHHHNASIPDPNASHSSSSGGSNGGGGGHGAW
ncbi:MAG: DUF2207 domain-containing protein [Clostridia bacterium]|nr:DUF2207 domain-containing protein [Clostridia bacterium]